MGFFSDSDSRSKSFQRDNYVDTGQKKGLKWLHVSNLCVHLQQKPLKKFLSHICTYQK